MWKLWELLLVALVPLRYCLEYRVNSDFVNGDDYCNTELSAQSE